MKLKPEATLMLGAALFLGGLIAAGFVAYGAQVYRYDNPKLTETELTLWNLSRWRLWGPALAVAAAGLIVMALASRRCSR